MAKIGTTIKCHYRTLIQRVPQETDAKHQKVQEVSR